MTSLHKPDSYYILQCPSCGLGKSYPLSPSNDFSDTYYECYTERGPAKNKSLSNSLKRLLASGINNKYETIRILSQKISAATMQVVLPAPFGNKRVLDVGCGYGRLLDYFKLSGWHTFGVEPGVKASALCRKNGHNVLTGTLDAQSFESNYFSAVVLCHSLEHIPIPMETLTEIYRIMSPRGLLIIDVPNSNCADAIFFKTAWYALVFPHHIFHWTSRSLTHALRRTGFTIDHFRYKIPKYSDYVVNYRNSRSQPAAINASIPQLLFHILKVWTIGRTVKRRSQYGHYISCYAIKKDGCSNSL